MRTCQGVVLLIIALSICIYGGCSACAYRVTGQGTKVGTVIKLSQEGFLVGCKTWEGELIRGGLASGSGGFSTTPLYFTVNDPNLLEEVKAALDGQYEVEVTYTSYFGPMLCGSETEGNYFLNTIKRRDGK